MTLAELHRAIHRTSYHLSSEEIPLKIYGVDGDIRLDLKKDKQGNPYVLVVINNEPQNIQEVIDIMLKNQKPQAQIGNVVISDKQDRESKKW